MTVYTGRSGLDIFVGADFAKDELHIDATSLAAADVIVGGASVGPTDGDTLYLGADTYSAALFAGVAGIDQIVLGGPAQLQIDTALLSQGGVIGPNGDLAIVTSGFGDVIEATGATGNGLWVGLSGGNDVVFGSEEDDTIYINYGASSDGRHPPCQQRRAPPWRNRGKEAAMTPQQITLVRDSFRELLPDRDDVAAVFYNRLFAIDPTTKALFAKADLEAPGRKLMGALALVVNTIEQPQQLVGLLQALGRRHADYGVEPRHYVVVDQALIATPELNFRDRFTRALRQAWLAAFALISVTMMLAEEEAETQNAA